MPEIWTPASARIAREPAPRVRRCLTCGGEWPYEQRSQFERHAVRCSQKNAEIYEEHAAMMADSAFTGIYDTEQYEWLRRRSASAPRGA